MKTKLFVAMALASTPFCASHAMAASPFTYAAYEVGGDGGPLVSDQSVSDTVIVSGVGGYKARSSYGDNGVAIPSGGGYAVSIWSDGFVVNGGSGAGTLNFSVRLHGTLFAAQDVVYAMLMSSDLDALSPAAIVADSGDGYINVPGSTPVLLAEVDATLDFLPGPGVYQFSPGFIDETFSVNVPFVYGQTFYLASVLDIGGYGDFYNSAGFGITAPGGTSITSLSGSLYPAAAVPEAETYAMMLAGLGLVGFAARRRVA